MLEVVIYVLLGLIAAFVLLCAYMAYRLLLRDMGRVLFKFSFIVPSVEPKLVWGTYFDGTNDWNTESERLSFEVTRQSPLTVRTKSRLRGSDGQPTTLEWQYDEFEPCQRARCRLVRQDGMDVPDAAQSSETFEIARVAEGTRVDVEIEMPVRGSLRARLQRRGMEQVFADLRDACLEKAGVVCRLGPHDERGLQMVEV